MPDVEAHLLDLSHSQGFLHAASVLDLFSRKVVGWAVATHLWTELVLDVLGMAVLARRPRRG